MDSVWDRKHDDEFKISTKRMQRSSLSGCVRACRSMGIGRYKDAAAFLEQGMVNYNNRNETKSKR
eukprot:3483480-Rhodomonas_salina.2